MFKTCPNCHGSGFIGDREDSVCDGTGMVPIEYNSEIESTSISKSSKKLSVKEHEEWCQMNEIATMMLQLHI